MKGKLKKKNKFYFKKKIKKIHLPTDLEDGTRMCKVPTTYRLLFNSITYKKFNIIIRSYTTAEAFFLTFR